ncbi:hypothetical protein AB1Y20_021353 [Prymnesium parvum]|uniref:Uncharacterized protein n=1 Tax=Prymnesium parvum TaxID=97485 RepID=A0AB34JL07_PRYPA
MPPLSRREVLRRDLLASPQFSMELEDPQAFWSAVQAIGLVCANPNEWRILHQLFKLPSFGLKSGAADHAAQRRVTEEEIAQLEGEAVALQQRYADIARAVRRPPTSPRLQPAPSSTEPAPSSTEPLDAALGRRRRQRWVASTAGEAADEMEQPRGSGNPTPATELDTAGVTRRRKRAAEAPPTAATEPIAPIAAAAEDDRALLERCEALLRQDLAEEVRDCLLAVRATHGEHSARMTRERAEMARERAEMARERAEMARERTQMAEEREMLAEEVLALVHLLHTGSERRRKEERARAAAEAEGKAKEEALALRTCREEEGAADRLRAALSKAKAAPPPPVEEAACAAKEARLVEELASADDAAALGGAVGLSQLPRTARTAKVSGGALAVAARRTLQLLRMPTPEGAERALLVTLGRLAWRSDAAAAAALADGAVPLLLERAAAGGGGAELALSDVLCGADAAELRATLEAAGEAERVVAALLPHLRDASDETARGCARGVGAVLRAAPEAGVAVGPSAVLQLDAAGVSTAKAMSAAGGLPRHVLLLDIRTPASTLATCAASLDLLLRGDTGASVRASLAELRAVPRLCAVLRNGKAADELPSTWREAPPPRVLVPVLGALESAVSTSAPLQREAISAGGVEVLVALLRVLIKSDREMPLGKTHLLPTQREPELLPNLVLAIGAVVQDDAEGMARLHAVNGVDLLVTLLQSHPMSEPAVLAMQVLVDAGAKSHLHARVLDRALPHGASNPALAPSAAPHTAQLTALLALEKLARTLRRSKEESGR